MSKNGFQMWLEEAILDIIQRTGGGTQRLISNAIDYVHDCDQWRKLTEDQKYNKLTAKLTRLIGKEMIRRKKIGLFDYFIPRKDK